MKRLVILTCLVHLAIAGVQAQSKTLKVWLDSYMTLTADSTTVTYLKVYQSDAVEEYTSFNMSIVVPQGVKIHRVGNGDDIVLSERGAASHVIACNMPSDTLLKVACAKVVQNAGHTAVPGTVLSLDDGILVACGNGSALQLNAVVPEGKKRMDAADYIRGRKLNVGDLLAY